MKTASVADLRNNFARVSRWILEGESVTITKRGMVFATLIPSAAKRPRLKIDRLKRLQKSFPNGPLPGNVQDILDQERGET